MAFYKVLLFEAADHAATGRGWDAGGRHEVVGRPEAAEVQERPDDQRGGVAGQHGSRTHCPAPSSPGGAAPSWRSAYFVHSYCLWSRLRLMRLMWVTSVTATPLLRALTRWRRGSAGATWFQ